MTVALAVMWRVWSRLASMLKRSVSSRIARLAIVLAALAPPIVGASPAAADKIALVIGNDFYQNAQPLRRAVADARAVREHLESVHGFRVYYAENADGSLMGDAVAAFLGATQPGDVVALFFWGYGEYASFGVSEGLYLFPVDMPALEQFEAGRDSVIAARAISVDVVRDHLRRRNVDVRLFVFDARSSTGEAAHGASDPASGLGRIEAGRGEMLIYAAQQGQRALDSLGETDAGGPSVFTRVLLEQFQPEAPLLDMARNVQLGVDGLTSAAGLSQAPLVEAGLIDPNCSVDLCAPPPSAAGAADAAEGTTNGALRLSWDEQSETRRLAGGASSEPPTAFEQPLVQSVEPIEPSGETRLDETAPSGFVGLTLAPLGEGGSVGGAFGAPADSPSPFAPRIAAPTAPAAAGDAPPPSDAETEAAMAAYQDAKARDSMTALQLVAQIYPTTVWGRLAALDVEENRIKEQSTAALDQIAAAREALEWDRLRETRDAEALDAFIRAHEGGPLAAEASALRGALESELRAGQTELRRLRYYWGPIDGDWGPGSRRAMREFQSDLDLEPDGRLSTAMLKRLIAEPTPGEEVRAQPPETSPTPTPAAAAVETTIPPSSWRFRVEIQAELENGGRQRCVGAVEHPERALDSGRMAIDCGPIDSYRLRVRGDGELVDGAVYADRPIQLRGNDWSFVGAGFAGSPIGRVRVIVEPQVY